MLSTRNDISVCLVASNRFHYICVYIQTNFCKFCFISNRLFHTFLYVLCTTVIPRRICLSRSELYIYIIIWKYLSCYNVYANELICNNNIIL